MRQFQLRGGLMALLLSPLVLPIAPASAQYGVSSIADPNAVLAANLRTLATEPKNMQALIAAGRASLELGDVQSAAGFFGRAEESYPQSPLPKIGMGAAMTMSGDARAALTYFARAEALGAPGSTIALDRGMAYDLIGQQPQAQAEYRKAMIGPQADEARRRLALSLAISRNIKAAGATIEPLLARRDPESIRVNAFILALAGDREGARRTIDAAMPGKGAQFEPFFRLLPVLRPEEKAAAVHLGEFPKDAAQRYAQAQPISSSPVQSIGNDRSPGSVQSARPAFKTPVKVAARKSTPVRKPAEAPRRAEREVEPINTYLATVRPSLDPSRYASSRRRTKAASDSGSSSAAADPEPRPAASSSTPAVDALAPLEEPVVMARADPPPPPTPKLEIVTPPKPRPKVERRAEAVKAKVEAKKPPEPSIGAKGTYWVQLAGSGTPEAMPREFKRIKAKKPDLFAGRSPYVTQGKDYFRLVVGPFDSAGEAHAFVTKLDKAGIDSFTWTRSPAQIKIEKIAG